NKLINKEMRQAISYAINYTYVIEELKDGNAARMVSPIPEGIAYHKADTVPADYDVTEARAILIAAGLAQGLTAGSTDQEWIDLAASGTPVAAYGYQYNLGNVFREDLGILVKANLEAIGIAVTMDGMEWSAYLTLLLGEFDGLELYMIGWGPDYNDPSNFINPLFSNTSMSNGAQVNDDWLQNAMMEALITPNLTERRDLYYDIQTYIVEDLMPWVFLYVSLSRNVLSTSIENWYRNPMGQLDFFDITFNGVDRVYETGFDNQTNCGYEIVAVVVDPTDTDDTDDGPVIPGYSLVALIGIAAISVFTLIKRRK
ncbi:Loki-CTERM sorting domain-containing protein, partial [Candidatus Babeliales bacterium]|nr:Loki-CTERM sorting domain-containing protein [Candidatus Babeliales bacterium]